MILTRQARYLALPFANKMDARVSPHDDKSVGWISGA